MYVVVLYFYRVKKFRRFNNTLEGANIIFRASRLVLRLLRGARNNSNTVSDSNRSRRSSNRSNSSIIDILGLYRMGSTTHTPYRINFVIGIKCKNVYDM